MILVFTFIEFKLFSKFSCFLYWTIVDLPLVHYVSFKCAVKWFSYSHIHIYIFRFQIVFCYSLLQDVEYSSLCYTVNFCFLHILCILVYLYISIFASVRPILLIYPSPFGNHKLVSYVCESVFVLYIDSFVLLFDSTISDIIWYLSFSIWLHLFWYFLGPSILLQMAIFYSFSWPSYVPFSVFIALSIYMCISHLIKPICWWAFGLLLYLGYCK